MKRFLSSSYLLLCCLLLCLGGQLSSGHYDEENAAVAITPAYSLQNATKNNTGTNNTTSSPAPTPAVKSKPPSSGHPTTSKVFTHAPTKKYVPPPDDNNDNENDNNNDEKKNRKNTGVTAFWTLACLAMAVFVLFYFRNNIAFFFGNAWRNTQRYGCKGFMHSFFPCFCRGLSPGGHQPLDQIIFETDESSYTRSNLREGLM